LGQQPGSRRVLRLRSRRHRSGLLDRYLVLDRGRPARGVQAPGERAVLRGEALVRGRELAALRGRQRQTSGEVLDAALEANVRVVVLAVPQVELVAEALRVLAGVAQPDPR